MKEILYNNEQLLKATEQLQADWERLYPNRETDNPLYGGLQYHRYLCEKRGLKLKKTTEE